MGYDFPKQSSTAPPDNQPSQFVPASSGVVVEDAVQAATPSPKTQFRAHSGKLRHTAV